MEDDVNTQEEVEDENDSIVSACKYRYECNS